jgi:hypothetical protein
MPLKKASRIDFTPCGNAVKMSQENRRSAHSLWRVFLAAEGVVAPNVEGNEVKYSLPTTGSGRGICGARLYAATLKIAVILAIKFPVLTVFLAPDLDVGR